MRIFVYEFVSGGGLVAEQLSDNLARQADTMLQALLRDVTALPGVEVVTTRDARMPALTLPVEVLAANEGEHPVDHFLRGVALADAVWPIAPEVGGILEGLTELVDEKGKPVLSSRVRAVRAAGSKLLTATVLRANQIDCVPTFGNADSLPQLDGAWVLKPDDGAGCSNTLIVPNIDVVREAFKRNIGSNLVAQPWLEGQPISLSLLCAEGQARLLSCNRMQVGVRGDAPVLDSIFVNAVKDHDGTLKQLGERIAAVFTGLWGHVGVDLIMQDGKAVVLEVNPRLTTSYAGLSRALGVNAAKLVLDLHATGNLPAQIPNSGKPAILDW